MYTRKPFYRRFNDGWYVQNGSRQFLLAKGKASETDAHLRYLEVMTDQPSVQVNRT
jgi:hypothetical protein